MRCGEEFERARSRTNGKPCTILYVPLKNATVQISSQDKHNRQQVELHH